MSTDFPVYRLRIYASREVDPDEATVLTPAAGAPHSLPFQLTTQPGVAGWLPLLAIPEGRGGQIDLKSRRTSIGNYTFRFLDPAIGTDQLLRYLTAYAGNAQGQPELLGNKVYAQESIDGGVTFRPYVVGRCMSRSFESMVWHGIRVRDFAEDFKKIRVFTHRSTASYAIEPLVLPLGLSSDYGDATAAAPLTGTIQAPTHGSPYRTLVLDPSSKNRVDNLVTEALRVQFGGYLSGQLGSLASLAPGLGSTRVVPTVRCRFSAPGLGITDKELQVRRVYFDAFSGAFNRHWRVSSLLVDALRHTDSQESLATDDPFYQAFTTGAIPNGTAVTFTLRLLQLEDTDTEQTGDLYLGDANIAQFWQDLQDGLFSRRYESGETPPAGRTIGDPVWTVPYKAAAFAALAPSLPTARWHVTKAMDLFDVVEKWLCQPYGLAYRFTPVEVAGVPTCQLEPVSVQLPSAAAIASLPSLNTTHLKRDAELSWEPDATQAITTVRVNYFSDIIAEIEDIAALPDQVPAVPPSLIQETKNFYRDPTFGRYVSLDRNELVVDAPGIRGSDRWSEVVNGQQRDAEADNQARAVAESFRPFYAGGFIPVRFTVLRDATTIAIREGDFVVCDFPWPNPSTNTLGGGRLIFITGRQERGPYIEFAGADAGLTSSAGAPTVGTPTQTAGNTHHSIDDVVTLNASNAMAFLRIAVKDTTYGTASPLDDDPSWIPAAQCYATGTYAIRNLPSGKRIFVSANSRPTPKDGAAKELPSGYAKPAGTKYVDTAAYTAPSAVTITPNPVTGASQCLLTWTPGEATLPAKIYLDSGSGYVFLFRVAPGTSGPVDLLQYVEPGGSYTVGVSHEDTLGGETAMGSRAFTVDSGATGPTLTAPTITKIVGIV